LPILGESLVLACWGKGLILQWQIPLGWGPESERNQNPSQTMCAQWTWDTVCLLDVGEILKLLGAKCNYKWGNYDGALLAW
jgi:hypothetical protein